MTVERRRYNDWMRGPRGSGRRRTDVMTLRYAVVSALIGSLTIAAARAQDQVQDDDMGRARAAVTPRENLCFTAVCCSQALRASASARATGLEAVLRNCMGLAYACSSHANTMQNHANTMQTPCKYHDLAYVLAYR